MSDGVMRNGSGAAAVLAAGVGSFVLAVMAELGDKFAAVKGAMIFYKPTGPLSGVTTVAIAVWLASWGLLALMWRDKDVRMGRIGAIALVLLGLALLLMFPPIGDWL
jgi:hypothetical protein